MTEPDSFDDSPEYRPPPSLTRRLRQAPRWVWLTAVGAIAALALGPKVWGFSLRPDYHIRLYGPNVDRLEVNAPVALGVQRIGQVTRVETREGRVVAELALKRIHARELSADTGFLVGSLNDWLPGNVGVRVKLAETREPFVPLEDGALVRAPDQLLPIEVPPRFYWLLGGAALVMTAVLAGARVLAEWTSRLILVVVAAGLIAAVFVALGGTISTPPWEALR